MVTCDLNACENDQVDKILILYAPKIVLPKNSYNEKFCYYFVACTTETKRKFNK